MDELLAYLNGLSKKEQIDFASRCKTTIGYLRKAISKGHKLGTELSVLIETESGQRVTRKILHPNDWAAMWPELVTAA